MAYFAENVSIAARNKYKGLQAEWIRHEALRCLDCFDPPCQKQCPAEIPIPRFIYALKSGNLSRAAELVRDANPVAAICGKVCPEEVFCQSPCTRGKIDEPLKIRELHDYATGFEETVRIPKKSASGNVAIIGSGPAGLSCAAKLAAAGIDTTIFEAKNYAGGVPSGSIPKFRLPDEIISKDLAYVRNCGATIITGQRIIEPTELLKEYGAIFIAAGLQSGKRLNIPGEEISGAYSALEFLELARAGALLPFTGKKAVIIGGGNVSLDVASAAAEIGAGEVRLLYRRGPNEMKIWKSELAEAVKRGVIIDCLTTPTEIKTESGMLKGVVCQKMELTGKRDPDGRRQATPVPQSKFGITADIIIVAVGLISNYKRKIVGAGLSTSIPGIYAGGDWVRGEGTIVEAARDGKLAAVMILRYLNGKKI